MDRRQAKTRSAIFTAFIELVGEKSYEKITIQEIIEKADIGRSTFYIHFETKEDLLDAVCSEVFDHILHSAEDIHHTHGSVQIEGQPNSVICHMLQHIRENDHSILTLFSSEENSFFLFHFKDHLKDLVSRQFDHHIKESSLPEEFVVNHISGSLVEMIQWWIKGGLTQDPKDLDQWFQKALFNGI